MKTLLILNLYLVFLFMSCSPDKVQKTNATIITKGTYTFTMTDTAETKLAEGTLVITESSNSIIKGKYTFENVYKEFQGYSSMKGQLEGAVNSSSMTVLINTNPTVADDNIFFNVKIEDDAMKGTWYYSAFRKQDITGRIIIIKKQ